MRRGGGFAPGNYLLYSTTASVLVLIEEGNIVRPYFISKYGSDYWISIYSDGLTSRSTIEYNAETVEAFTAHAPAEVTIDEANPIPMAEGQIVEIRATLDWR